MTKLSRKEQIIADAERRLNFKIKELRYEIMKKKMETEGLWANIHAKRKRGERMRKKGEKGAPTPDAMDRAKAGSQPGNTSTSEALTKQQEPFLKRTSARFPKLPGKAKESIVMAVKPKGQINSKRYVELGDAYDKKDYKEIDKLLAKYAKEDRRSYKMHGLK